MMTVGGPPGGVLAPGSSSLGREFGGGDLVVAEGVGDDRGAHLQDVLADRGGPAGEVGMPRSLTSAGQARSVPISVKATARRSRWGPAAPHGLVVGGAVSRAVLDGE